MINVEAINAAVSSPLAAAHLLGLKPARGSRDHRAVVLCPWHNEKHPSCVLVEKAGRVVGHCKSCNTGGDFVSLVAAVNGLDHRHDFRKVAEIAGGLVGVQLDDGPSRREPSAPVTSRPERRDPIVELAKRIDTAARDWLAGRDPKPDPVIDGATPEEANEALAVLWDAIDAQALRDAEVEWLADAYEESKRNLWLHPPRARARKVDA